MKHPGAGDASVVAERSTSTGRTRSPSDREPDEQGVHLSVERRLSAIVTHSDYAIYSKDLDGVITSWNPAAERLYGYSEGEAIGRPIRDLIPEDISGEERVILDRITAGEHVNHYETRRRRKDGSIVDVALSISGIKDANGVIVGDAVISRDITEEREEAELLEEQADMLDLVDTAIMARDADGTITYWNSAAEQYYGYTKEEAVGRLSHELLGTELPDDVSEIQARFARDGRWEGELVHTGKDGRKLSVWCTWVLRHDASGDPQVLEANNDLTVRKMAEEAVVQARDEAERANRAKSEFLSRMSHELRTPLNAILGFAQLLQMDELGADQRDSLEQIVKGGERLLDLINEVLDISRIESGTLRLSIEPVVVCDVIRESIALIKPLARERGIDVQVRVPEELNEQHAQADRQRLGQAVLNLLSNAVKYNVDGGLVTVSCEAIDGMVRVGVTDTGPGIAPEKIPLLFTPFERLGAEMGAVEGTGLGLALSKNLIEAMNGRMLVDTMMGRGTTFWIELDRASAPDGGVESPDEPFETTFAKGRSILYIEDNLSNLKLVERVLARQGDINVIPAMTGQLGLELARQHLPDLILLDLHLPDMTGHEVLIRLRKDPVTARTPIVVLSADATPGQVERLRAAGAHDYLTKPLDLTRLLQLLDEIFEVRSKEDS